MLIEINLVIAPLNGEYLAQKKNRILLDCRINASYMVIFIYLFTDSVKIHEKGVNFLLNNFSQLENGKLGYLLGLAQI